MPSGIEKDKGAAIGHLGHGNRKWMLLFLLSGTFFKFFFFVKILCKF